MNHVVHLKTNLMMNHVVHKFEYKNKFDDEPRGSPKNKFDEPRGSKTNLMYEPRGSPKNK